MLLVKELDDPGLITSVSREPNTCSLAPRRRFKGDGVFNELSAVVINLRLADLIRNAMIM